MQRCDWRVRVQRVQRLRVWSVCVAFKRLVKDIDVVITVHHFGTGNQHKDREKGLDVTDGDGAVFWQTAWHHGQNTILFHLIIIPPRSSTPD